MRGRKWLMDATKEEKIFVTKADKGGATDDQLTHINHLAKSLAINMKKKNLITDDDKTVMTGLTENNHSKLAPEYRPESPYVYPLFKIHKLNREEIANKMIPPNRLVHASKFSPIYRMEKWTSPHLTKISREHCKEEFILDKRHLIINFKEINDGKKLQNENIHLFTLDVEKLNPSIQPQLALIAIKEVFAANKSTDTKTKQDIIEFSFENSYVSYKEETFSSKIGIPTGGSLSRQIADIFLHWVLFKKVNPNIATIEAIRLFKRFIDASEFGGGLKDPSTSS